MASSQLLYPLLLVSCVLCGHAWGKAVDLQDTEERGIETKERGLETENSKGLRLESQHKEQNPCVYKGKVLSIDVRYVGEKLK